MMLPYVTGKFAAVTNPGHLPFRAEQIGKCGTDPEFVFFTKNV